MVRPFYLQDPSNPYFAYMICVYPGKLPHPQLQTDIRTLLTLQETDIVPSVEAVWSFNGYTYVGMHKCYQVYADDQFRSEFQEDIEHIHTTLRQYDLQYTGTRFEEDLCIDAHGKLRLLTCSNVRSRDESAVVTPLMSLFHPNPEESNDRGTFPPFVLFATHRAGQPERFGPFIGPAVAEIPIPPNQYFVHPIISPFPRER